MRNVKLCHVTVANTFNGPLVLFFTLYRDSTTLPLIIGTYITV